MRLPRDRNARGSGLSDPSRRFARGPSYRRRATSRRLRHEVLEPRVVLSPTIITVDSSAGGAARASTSGTLAYVISQSNAKSNQRPDAINVSQPP